MGSLSNDGCEYMAAISRNACYDNVATVSYSNDHGAGFRTATVMAMPRGVNVTYGNNGQVMWQTPTMSNEAVMGSNEAVMAGTNVTAPPPATVQQVVYAGTNDPHNLQGKPPESFWRRIFW